MLKCLVHGHTKFDKYSENIRQFSIRQQYFSNAAYESLRNFFGGHLPTRRVTQMWMRSIDGSPGISESALNIIRERAKLYQAKEGHQLCLCLISDEMSIKKEVTWCSGTNSFIGFSTVTNSSQQCTSQNESNLKTAKDALVLLVAGPDFKVPVAYHLLNGLETVDRAALTIETIKEIEATDARVISLTSDGLAANIAVAEMLGANFGEDKPYFHSHTNEQQKIYIIFDPPHMLKLVRKHFCNEKIFHKGRVIDWNLIRVLAEKQSSSNFNLCNRLTMQHIKWHQLPMNVSLATQTISKSVADALEQLSKDEYEEFKDSKATVEFIRNFNDAFDILNCANKTQKDGTFRQPLCVARAELFFDFSARFQRYLMQLELQTKTKKVPLLGSRVKMGFFGFYHNFTSLRGIYEDFVQNGPFEIFYPFQFSQDHLETLFSLIRYVSVCCCHLSPNSYQDCLIS